MLIIDFSELNEEEWYNIIFCYFKYFNVEEGDEKKVKKRFVKEIEDENEFFFFVMIDLIYINERWRGIIV